MIQHLFYGFRLDETLDGSVNHRIDTLVHCKFLPEDIRGQKFCGSAQQYIRPFAKEPIRRQQRKKDLIPHGPKPCRTGFKILPRAFFI